MVDLGARFPRLHLSEGERSLCFAYLGVGLFGAGVSFSIVNQLGGEAALLRPFHAIDFWMIFAGLCGACGGLWLGRGWFGHAGRTGMWKLLRGLPAVTLIATVIGGTLALPIYGTMFGPFAVAVTFWQFPMLALFWLATLLSAHSLFSIWRRERDSIFAEHDDGIPA